MKNNIPTGLRSSAGIYEIRNTVNGKVYIGQTINFYNRKACHLSMLHKNVHSNAHLQAAFNLDGIDAFSFTILEVVINLANEPLGDFQERLYSTERAYIELLRASEPQFGYNIRSEFIECGVQTSDLKSSDYNESRRPSKYNTYNHFLVKEVKILLRLKVSASAITRYLPITLASLAAIKYNKTWQGITVSDADVDAYIPPSELSNEWAIKDKRAKRRIVALRRDSTLTEQSIIEIAGMLRQGVLVKNIAKIFGVHRETITEIKKGERWGNISEIKAGDLRNTTIKLTASQALEIKDLLLKKNTPVTIAPIYGVSPHLISAIAKGKCWSSVTGLSKTNRIDIVRIYPSSKVKLL